MKFIKWLGAVGMLALFFFSSCGKDKHPEYPYLSALEDDILQLDYIFGGVSPFVYNGQLLYERSGCIYDEKGDSVVRLESHTMRFTGELDPKGQLIYSTTIFKKGAPELRLFSLSSAEAEQTIELFSLSELRKNAEESRRSFELSDSVRSTLEKVGCFLPAYEKAPVWNTEVFNREYDYEPTLKSLRQNLRQIRDEDEERERYRKELSAYLDGLQQKYETAISRFIEGNRAGAYSYRFLQRNRNDQIMEWIVLPAKGVAFEKTAGIKFRNLPAYALAEPLPKWDKKRTDITLRRTGSSSWISCEFKLVASMIPWIDIHRERRYYYALSVAGHTWNFKTETPVELLDGRGVADSVWFSLINEDKDAYLFRCTN